MAQGQTPIRHFFDATPACHCPERSCPDVSGWAQFWSLLQYLVEHRLPPGWKLEAIAIGLAIFSAPWIVVRFLNKTADLIIAFRHLKALFGPVDSRRLERKTGARAVAVQAHRPEKES